MQQVLEKRVRTIAPTIEPVNVYSSQYAIKRVAAYCRVSTKQDEQLNSYENQVNYYTERIRREAGWKLAGIYADKGITGTSMKKRDEFNKLIRQCRRGKVDMIIVKSISRFARNTLDCIKITRMLREIKVDVYFEEQNLHSIDPASEFYISIHGSIAQSESENISHNVAWGKARSAKEGNVSFSYKSFLGYRKGADGKPEIVPEQAVTVRQIYERFLSGRSLQQIADELTGSGIPTPMGKPYGSPASSNPSSPTKSTRGMLCWAKPTQRTASARKCASTPGSARNTMWRTIIRQSSMQPPSPEYRKNWQGGHLNARSSRLEPKRSKANTPASMR